MVDVSTDLSAAAAALTSASEIEVACHVNPDGDALGSLFGAAIALRKAGKQVRAAWDGGPELPPGYRFLPGQGLVVQPGDLGGGVLLALDCGAVDRLGALESLARDGREVVNIDHHRGNDEFGTINVVDPDASSTAELVARLLGEAGIEVDRDIATCLYTGIFTDTGSFQYANASPDTLRLAADLLDHGVEKTAIAQEVFDTSPFGYLRLAAQVLGRARLTEDARFIHSVLTRDDLRATGVAMEETDKLIDLLRSTRDADVAVLFKEQGDGTFRASARSKGRVNVGEIARAHGGGGHDLAAGFTVGNVDRAVEDIVTRLREQA